MRRVRRAGLSALLVLGAVGCDGPGVVSATGVRLARTGAVATPAQAIVGTWRRSVFFVDEFRFAQLSETTFQFAADGTVLRATVARNFTLDISDVAIATGRWRLEGTQLVLDFLTPSAFQVTLLVRLVGDQLDLSGQTFLRVTP
ncbi:MAG: hypothetical protein ACT4P7_05015 [Gemmatimonadaceae bacterium]